MVADAFRFLTPPQRADVRSYFRRGVDRWLQIDRELILAERSNPPQDGRLIALVL
jgi:hypothetical protein